MFNNMILWNLSYGVYVISAMDNGKPTGCIANCAMQLTTDTIAISLNRQNHTNDVIKRNKEFSISILSNNSDRNIISVFGFTSGRDKNKFENIDYTIINNLPIIKDCSGYITLKTIQELELETHTLFIAKITGGDLLNNEIPMTYKYYHDVIKGRAPKAAPTYIDPEKIVQDEENGKEPRYKCKICGYIYEGDITKEDINYVCPICKQPKSVFIPF
ncbi:MAG: flavin reductase [Candidatus Avigastranaerophilus sp.]